MPDSIRIIGLDAMERAFSSAAEKLTTAATKVVADEVELIRDDARRTAPRRTGELRAHIDAASIGLEGSVKSTARHAGFVEHGTYRDKAQPYMKPAAERARLRLPKRAASVIRAALGG